MFRCKVRESIERVVRIHDCMRAPFLRVLGFMCLDGFGAVRIDEVVELWRLADMYQLVGLKQCCLGSPERESCK